MSSTALDAALLRAVPCQSRTLVPRCPVRCCAMPACTLVPRCAVLCCASLAHQVPAPHAGYRGAMPCQPRAPGASRAVLAPHTRCCDAGCCASPACRVPHRAVPPVGRLRRAGAGCSGSSPLSCARRGTRLPSRTNGMSAAGGFRCLGFFLLHSVSGK